MAKRIDGVYAITCKVNGRRYVGSAANISVRWATHRGLLRRGVHTNAALQADWNEHGASAFEFRTVAEVRESGARRSVEQVFLDEALASGVAYNRNPSAFSNAGLKLTEDQRLAMSLARTGRKISPEGRAAMSEGAKRRYAPVKGTPEIRDRMAELGKGNLGKPKTAEHARNIGLGKRVLSDEQIREAQRRLAAGEYGTSIAREMGVHQSTISNIKRGRLKAADAA